MDGRTDGRADGRTDGRTDGHTEHENLSHYPNNKQVILKWLTNHNYLKLTSVLEYFLFTHKFNRA